MPSEGESSEIGFEDIPRLPNRDIQALLRAVDGKDLALALRGAKGNLRNRIFENVSSRAGELLRDEMKLAASAKEPDILQAQSVVTQAARRLQALGQITWPPSVDSDDPSGARARPAKKSKKHATRKAPQAQTRRYLIGIGGTLAGVALLALLSVLGDSGKQADTASDTGTRKMPRSSAPSSRQSVVTQPQKQQNASEGTTENSGSRKSRTGSESTRTGASEGTERTLDGGTLRPGDEIETGGDEQAVLDLGSNVGKLRAAPNTSILVDPESRSPGLPRHFNMRAGNVLVEVEDPVLEVNAALARITASKGALYRLRVVLDATTTISVFRGTARVEPRVETDTELLVLSPGDQVKIHPTGKIERDTFDPPD